MTLGVLVLVTALTRGVGWGRVPGMIAVRVVLGVALVLRVGPGRILVPRVRVLGGLAGHRQHRERGDHPRCEECRESAP
jgi:hypothetical protein